MKKIILLSDGTGNGAAKRHKTNVWRLYRALDLHVGNQIAMHDDGVGSQEFFLFKLLGGAFGYGLKRNVLELYEFLCRNYQAGETEADSDKIYLFGFSRGAFTVRVLAGLIAECGLCTNFNSASDLRKKARRNFSVYRSRFRHRQLTTWFTRKRTREDAFSDIRPKIEFIGVWDTVDAYGLPFDGLTKFCNRVIFPMRFPDQRLWKRVKKACHAISVDDERKTLEPVLWDESNEKDANRIKQVWFAGSHADVGGGYPRHELSIVSLDWMISEVEVNEDNLDGLNFREDLRNEHRQRSNWHGAQHDSRRGLAAHYRYKPRDIQALCNDSKNRVHIPEPKIHRSVFERIRGNVVPYAPTGLPADYQVVSTRGGNNSYERKQQATARHKAMKGALEVIRWRKCLYYAFLIVTFMSIISGVIFCSQYFLDWLPCSKLVFVRDLTMYFIKIPLPDVFSGWLKAFWQNPCWLVVFVFVYVLLSILKCIFSAKTRDRATAAWAADGR